MRQRRINFKHLLTNLSTAPLIIFHRAQCTGALGEFYECNPDIIDKRNQHLAHVVLLPMRLSEHGTIEIQWQIAYRGHAQNAAQ